MNLAMPAATNVQAKKKARCAQTQPGLPNKQCNYATDHPNKQPHHEQPRNARSPRCRARQDWRCRMSFMSLFLRREPAPSIIDQAKSELATATSESLEDVLIELSKWGRPRIGQFSIDGTWCCSIKVNVTATGVTFEARSDFKQPTPLDAALMCRQNLRDTVKAIGGAA